MATKHLIQCLALSNDANCPFGVGSLHCAPSDPCLLESSLYPCEPSPQECGWDLVISSNEENTAQVMDVTSKIWFQ